MTTAHDLAPSVTAEQLGRQLAQVLTVVIERFRTLADDATAAIERGEYEQAEQLCADETGIYRLCDAVLDRYGISEYHASDRLGELLIACTGTGELDALLEEHSPERKARRRAWCIEHGFDPDEDDVVTA